MNGPGRGRWWDGDWPGMMGDMDAPTMVWIAIALALLAVVLALIVYFRRPASGHGLARDAVARVDAPHVAMAPMAVSEDDSDRREEDMFLVIPDISGYTRFLNINRFALGHAQRIISDLLSAVIEGAGTTLSAAKIEGDAILFTAPAGKDEGMSDEDIGVAIRNLLRGFYIRRRQLDEANLCPCDACRHIRDLDLKVVAHRGPVLRYRLGGSTELSGVPMIVVHRLLKNSVASNRYVLFTEAAARSCRPPFERPAATGVENCDGVGEIPVRVYEFDIEDLRIPEPQAMKSGEKAREMARKLAANVQTLTARMRPGA